MVSKMRQRVHMLCVKEMTKHFTIVAIHIFSDNINKKGEDIHV